MHILFTKIGIGIMAGITAIGGLFSHQSMQLGVNQKISELTSGTPASTDIFPYTDLSSNSTKKATLSSILSGISATYPVVNTSNVLSLAFGTTTNNNWSGNNVFQNASSTFTGSVMITGNSTTTNATTTNSFSTNASSTNEYGTNFYGGAIASCSGSNALQWTGGVFGCVTTGGSGPTVFSTTTSGDMSSTTLRISDGSLPNKTIWDIYISSARFNGAASSTASIRMRFNNDNSLLAYGYAGISTDVSSFSTPQDASVLFLSGLDGSQQKTIHITVYNTTGMSKWGTFSASQISTTTTAGLQIMSSVTRPRQGQFWWASTTPITRIDIGVDLPTDAYWATSTQIYVIGS